MNRIFAIVGPSGSGKTFATELLKRSFGARIHVSVSDTTRAPRPGECDGRDYHFVSDEAFEENLTSGRYVEWTEFGGARYAVREDELYTGQPTVIVVEPEGLKQIVRRYGDVVRCVYITAPENVRFERMAATRGEEAAKKRLAGDDIEARWHVAKASVPLRIIGEFCGPDAAWEAFAAIAEEIAETVDPVNPHPKRWRVHPVVDGEDGDCRRAHWDEAPSLWTLYAVDGDGHEWAVEDFPDDVKATLAIPRFERCRGCAYLAEKESRWACEACGKFVADILACPEQVS